CNDTTGTAAPTWPPTMRGPLGAAAVGAAATTGGGAPAPAASWARADTGIVTARARAAAGSSFRTVLVMTVVMTMVFSFRNCGDPLWGLRHCDRLRWDGECPGDGSVAGGMFL